MHCGYPGCKFYGRPDTFRIHNKRRHGGHQNARVKDSGFEPGARFASYAPLPQVSNSETTLCSLLNRTKERGNFLTFVLVGKMT